MVEAAPLFSPGLLCHYFDGKNEHEAANTGPEARVVLLFDVLQEKYPAIVSSATR